MILSKIKLVGGVTIYVAGAIVTAVSIIGYLIVLVPKIIELISKDWEVGTSIIVLTVATILILIKLFWRVITEEWNLFKKNQISNNLETKIAQGSKVNLLDFLPSNSTAKDVLELSKLEASSWSHDSLLDSYNFYIDVNGQQVKRRFQIAYTSKFLNQEFTIYYPGESRNDQRAISLAETAVIPYFNNQLWSKGVKLAYQKVRSQLPSEYEFRIQCVSKEKISISFGYKQGSMEENRKFLLVVNKLTLDDGTIIEIS